MKLQQILENVEYSISDNAGDISNIEISDVVYDSRKCSPNCLFVAMKGEQADGHNYIASAIEYGATAIVCDKDYIPHPNTKITYIHVSDTRLALAKIAYNFYDKPNDKLIIIGITGTNGKTTTAYLVQSILENAGEAVGMIGTTGIFINNTQFADAVNTTPESLELVKIFKRMVEQNVKYVVMEVSSHSLVQHRVAMINFQIAAFTNLTHDHLDYHKTEANYVAAKRILFDNLSSQATAIVNADDTYHYKMLEFTNAHKVRISGRYRMDDYFFDDIQMDTTNSSFVLHHLKKSVAINTSLVGYFNIQNAAMAAAICMELGIDADNISDGLMFAKGAPGRLQAVSLRSGAMAYVDYAHTPDALEKALLACRELLTSPISKLFCVFGCGGDRDKTKRPEMGHVAEQYADAVIITDDNPRTESSDAIISDIMEGIDSEMKTQIISDRKSAIEYAVRSAKPDDIILVAGKGHEDYQIIGKTKFPFSDVDILKKL